MKRATFERSAHLDWQGDVLRGAGSVRAATAAFTVGATFPSLRGEAAGLTTPEELLAAAHAVCFGIGLRSVLARHEASASRIALTAPITAEKGPEGIRILSSHIRGVVHELEGLDPTRLTDVGKGVEQGCTISNTIRGSVAITFELISA